MLDRHTVFAVVLATSACRAPDPGVPTPSSDDPIPAYDPVAHVDPFLGTGGVGAQIASVSPGASRPFGMVLVGPDTRAAYGAPGFYHCAGYHWPDTAVMGFSHTHAHGMGVTDYGAIQVMPSDGWDPAKTGRSARALGFDHEREWAEPGWYAVELEGGIGVEIAATERGAAHTWTFPEGADPVLILDLGFALGDDHVEHGRVDVDLVAGTFSGVQNLHGAYSERFGGLLTHFAARLDPAPSEGGSWADGVHGDALSVEGAEVGLWLRFPPGTTEVRIDLAISYVDEAGALGNLQAELPPFDLPAVRAAATEAWRAELQNVRVDGTDDQRTMFHTAQYHTMLMPSLNADVDGRYRGLDQQIHTADHPYYSDFSLWDTFRTQHPWLILARPERQRDMVRSLIRMADDGGSLPRWPLAHGYTGGMVGTPAVQVLAESALKGLGGFDEARALDVSITASLEGQAHADRAGGAAYRANGVVTFEDAGQPASRTLEYAWSDHALALWAADAGRAEAPELASMAGSWRNTFDPAQGWFVGRYADGSFEPVGDPVAWADSYTEGNAWHYRWGAFWDADGMVDVTHGGDREAALAAMASYWDEVEDEDDDDLPDDFYWHGNEPDLHYAMLPALLGDPDLTARAVTLVRDTRYETGPAGLDGNDDAGTLSSWLLWQAIGLYPMAGTPTYVIGAPWFSRVEIDLEDGGMLVLRSEAGGAAGIGVDPVLTGPITHDELLGAFVR